MEQLFFESNFEALAFNYVSFGIFTIVNNVWTWIALITAALSFWSIRVAARAPNSSCSVTKRDPKPSSMSVIDNAGDECPPVLESEAKPIPSSTLVSAPAAVTGTSCSPSVRNDNTVSITKGEKFKLTVYYDGVGEDVVDGEMTATERGYEEWWESWERVLRVRKGERGWYRYQDLTAINGNVIKLWEENKACSRRYKRQ